MANTIQIKRRTSGSGALGSLAVGELGVDLTDSNKLYVGSSSGNQLLNPTTSGTLTSTGDFTIDSGDGIILDADGGAISLKDGGREEEDEKKDAEERSKRREHLAQLLFFFRLAHRV